MADDWNPSMPTWERLLIWTMFAWITVTVLMSARTAPTRPLPPAPPTVHTTGVPNG